MTLSRGLHEATGGLLRTVAAGCVAATILAVTWAGSPALASSSVPQSGTSAAPAPAAVKYYIVPTPGKGGPETLYDIALRTLGNGSLYREIFSLNQGRLQPNGARMEDPRSIDSGWILQLPADARGPGVRFGPLPVAAPATAPATTPASAPVSHPAAAPAAAAAHGGSLSIADALGGMLLVILLAGLAVLAVRRPWRRPGQRSLHGREGPAQPGGSTPSALAARVAAKISPRAGSLSGPARGASAEPDDWPPAAADQSGRPRGGRLDALRSGSPAGSGPGRTTGPGASRTSGPGSSRTTGRGTGRLGGKGTGRPDRPGPFSPEHPSFPGAGHLDPVGPDQLPVRGAARSGRPGPEHPSSSGPGQRGARGHGHPDPFGPGGAGTQGDEYPAPRGTGRSGARGAGTLGPSPLIAGQFPASDRSADPGRSGAPAPSGAAGAGYPAPSGPGYGAMGPEHPSFPGAGHLGTVRPEHLSQFDSDPYGAMGPEHPSFPGAGHLGTIGPERPHRRGGDQPHPAPYPGPAQAPAPFPGQLRVAAPSGRHAARQVAERPQPGASQALVPWNADSIRLAERILAEADEQATMIVTTAEQTAAEISQSAAEQAAAALTAAEQEAAQLRESLAEMTAQLGRVAASVMENLASPAMRSATRPALPADRAGAGPSAVVATTATGTTAAPATRPRRETPARPATKPGVSPRRNPKPKPASTTKSRQVSAWRKAVAAMVALVAIGVTISAAEIGRHGYAFFVFRNTGAGAGNPGDLTENQGPGQPGAPGAHHQAHGGTQGGPATKTSK